MWHSGYRVVLGLWCLAFTLFPALTFAGQVLEYGAVAEKALRHAYDIRMADLDIRISRASHLEARSQYYPILSARWNSEYVKDLTGGTEQVTAVGNTVLVENTMYQNSLSLGATYTLFDFGVRDRRVGIAARDVEVRRAVFLQNIRETKIKVLNLYSDLLTTSKELETKKQLLTLHKELALTRERLHAVGDLSRPEVVDEALKTVRAVDAVEQLRLRFKTILEDLSFYTGETYDADNLKVAEFEKSDEERSGAFHIEDAPEYRIYALEIEKKKAELEAVRRERLPQLAAYSSYIWYGNDLSAYGSSIADVKPRNFVVGIAATLPLFDGFKNASQVERLQAEVERLRVEKEKKLAELKGKYTKLTAAKRSYSESMEHQNTMLKDTALNLSMSERLSAEQIVEYAELLERRIEMVNRQFEVAKIAITEAAAVKELEIMSGTEDR